MDIFFKEVTLPLCKFLNSFEFLDDKFWIPFSSKPRDKEKELRVLCYWEIQNSKI